MTNHANTSTLLRALMAALLCLGLALPALAQDEGDTLLAEDGDLRIYRAEDGRIKIKRDGDEDWIAVIDPDREGRTFVFSGSGDWFDDDEPGRVIIDRLRDRDDDAWVGFFGPDRDFAVDVEPLALAQTYSHMADDLAGGMRWNMQQRAEINRKDAEARRLARRALRAEGDERGRLESELDALLAEIFDAKQSALQEQLERMEEQAGKLRTRHNEREQMRSEIIQRRKNELLGERDPLDW